MEDRCILDDIYGLKNESDIKEMKEFCNHMIDSVKREYTITIPDHTRDKLTQIIATNEHHFRFLDSVIKTSLQKGNPYVTVSTIQFILARETSFQTTIGQQLTATPDRLQFYTNEWLPFLLRQKQKFKENWTKGNEGDLMMCFVNRMMEAWQIQSVNEPPEQTLAEHPTVMEEEENINEEVY